MKKLTIALVVVTSTLDTSYCSQSPCAAQTSVDACHEVGHSTPPAHAVYHQAVSGPKISPESYEKVVPRIKKRSLKETVEERYNYMVLMAGIYYIDARDYWKGKVKQLKKFGRSFSKHA